MISLPFILKMMLSSGCFLLYYYCFLRNRPFHQWNRIYLLLSVLISLYLPFLLIEINQLQQLPRQAITLLQPVAGYRTDEGSPVQEDGLNVDTGFVLTCLYGGISTLLLIRLLYSFYLLRQLHRAAKRSSQGLFIMNESRSPFSFFRRIYWNDAIDPQSEEGKKILEHERVHIEQGHSYDKLFMQLVLVIAWINPFYWLIRQELHMVHEFIADQRSAGQGETVSFSRMILAAVFPGRANELVNPFYQSPIKRRLMMISKTNLRFPLLARIAALPAIALITLAFSFRPATNYLPLAKPLVVVIDAGHGQMENGQYNGAQGHEVSEDEIVLKLAKRFSELNSNPNISIVLSRPGSEVVSLQKRVAIAGEHKADLFVSLHMNAIPMGSKAPGESGFSVSVGKTENPFNAKSELLGSAFVQELSSVYKTKPGLVKPSMNIFVLNRNVCPSIIVDCGYVTNKDDVSFIQEEKNRDAVVRKMLTAIERYASQVQ